MFQVRKAIATLLSFCMMFSIMAQVSVARAEEMPVSDAATQQDIAQSEESDWQQSDPRAASSETALEPEAFPEEVTGFSAEEAELPAESKSDGGEETVRPDAVGEIEVSIFSALPSQRSTEFMVRIARGGETVGEQPLTLPADGQSEAPSNRTVRFDGLENGSYTLTVQGSGFETYTQTLDVQDLVCSVQLYTGYLAGFAYLAGEAHPGVLRIGDADGDGAIGQTDIDAVIDAMEAGGTAACDFDGSGSVDLTDLQMLAQNYQDTRDNLALVSSM